MTDMTFPEDPRITDRIGETIFKAQPYQLVVNVIEARRLFGTNINPVVTVTVGKEVQKTPAKFATNHPFYDSFFSFDLQRARQQLLTETIKIQNCYGYAILGVLMTADQMSYIMGNNTEV
ncbi:C2 domain protein [Opisthorchis viverrini]|uniref:C2 domain protein n=1 Tax=Opisthorchis viverrini TaxID=6198 RepID=A0A1S8WVW0_OPIVI|nr:C2 domain protein [Opisthorchis viverrini]